MAELCLVGLAFSLGACLTWYATSRYYLRLTDRPHGHRRPIDACGCRRPNI